MHKLLFLALLGIGYLFYFQLHHGRGGLVDNAIIKAEIAKQEELNSKLRDRNEMMELKIAGLKGSSDSLEARARHELNLVRSNEVLILLPGSDVGDTPKATK